MNWDKENIGNRAKAARQLVWDIDDIIKEIELNENVIHFFKGYTRGGHGHQKLKRQVTYKFKTHDDADLRELPANMVDQMVRIAESNIRDLRTRLQTIQGKK